MTGVIAAMDPATEFSRFVDGLAGQLVARSPTFEAFVSAMPGVLPEEALAALRRMSGNHAERLAADAAIDRAVATIDQCAMLPLPHPLDSEFRFNESTARRMAAALIERTSDGDEILLIGVPSVALELASIDSDRQVRFLGPDNCVTAAVRSAFTGGRLLLDQGPGGTAAAALVDPPWYLQPMSELIRISAAGCRQGALVKLVLPPIGTRPHIEADRSTFLAVAASAGLMSTESGGSAFYRTPLFELAALERQGIARLPNWRRGEVLEFVAENPIRSTRWTAPRITELSVSGVRLRLVQGPAGGATLVPIHDHEVFPSISARAPRRDRATLWTTTNRAFAVDYELAHAALTEIAGMSSGAEVLHLGICAPENDLPRKPCVATDDRLIHQLVELVGRELDDARRLVGDDAWLMTGMEWRS